jgi:hypothetical protein
MMAVASIIKLRRVILVVCVLGRTSERWQTRGCGDSVGWLRSFCRLAIRDFSSNRSWLVRVRVHRALPHVATLTKHGNSLSPDGCRSPHVSPHISRECLSARLKINLWQAPRESRAKAQRRKGWVPSIHSPLPLRLGGFARDPLLPPDNQPAGESLGKGMIEISARSHSSVVPSLTER